MEMAALSVLAPLTGTRSTGTALASCVPGTTQDVVLPANTYGVPILKAPVTGTPYADMKRMVKSVGTLDTATPLGLATPAPGYPPPTGPRTRGSTAPRTPGGGNQLGTTISATNPTTPVPIVSVLGGPAMNFPADTQILWYPMVPVGISPLASLASAMAGGANLPGGALLPNGQPGPGADPLTGCPQIRQVLTWEGLGQTKAAADIWKAGTDSFPAVIVCWEGSDEGEIWSAKGRYGQRHKMRVYVVSTRLDGQHQRRDEGKMVVLAVAKELVYRGEVDGEVFSAPPTKAGAFGRLGLDPGSYVYTWAYENNFSLDRTERRSAQSAQFPLATSTQIVLMTYADDGTLAHELPIVNIEPPIPSDG
jgi:hypothetical protein